VRLGHALHQTPQPRASPVRIPHDARTAPYGRDSPQTTLQP
jgi:hypothetical protein